MKTLVIGGAGYIGSVLCEYLLNNGEVTVLDNLMYTQKSLLGYCGEDNFNFVKGDVRDAKLVKELIEKHDTVVNLAAYVGAEICDRFPNEATNVALNGIDNILKAMSKDQLLVYPMTNSGYGKMVDDKPCNEESPLTPVSLYGKLKVEAESTIIDYIEDYDNTPNALIFRLATVFGPSPRMRLDLLVNNFVYKAYKDKSLVLFEPHFRRNYIHVDDVCDVFEDAVKKPELFLDNKKTNTFNLGNDDANCTKLELAQTIKDSLPQTEIFISEHGSDPDKRDYLVSNEKLKKVLPKKKYISIKNGINHLIKAYDIVLREDY